MQTHPTHPSTNAPTNPPPTPYGAEQMKERLKAALASVKLASALAWDLDFLGDATSHPKGSEPRRVAQFRDELDAGLASLLTHLLGQCRWRAETTRSHELVSTMAAVKRGDGADAVLLMDLHEDLSAEDDAEDDAPESADRPAQLLSDFAWDTYGRVLALADFVDDCPELLRPISRRMDGWPMIVARGTDPLPELERIAQNLEIAAADPRRQSA